MKKRFKKATLAISIGAIVIIVIAFVVLGLALVLTKTIFKGATEQIPGIMDIADLGKEPTAETPLTVRKDISIKRGDEKQLDIGFYNRRESTAEDVEISIESCLSVATGLEVNESDMPSIRSLKRNVETSEPAGYLVYLKEEKKLPAGEYLCTIVAVTKSTDPTIEDDVHATQQVSLTITT